MHHQKFIIMPAALARAVAAIATAASLYACVGGNKEPTLGSVRTDGLPTHVGPEVFAPERGDLDYFPHRFPVPQGEIEALPAQF